jgi:NAD(P)H-quinone oxidoreductase subunit 5
MLKTIMSLDLNPMSMAIASLIIILSLVIQVFSHNYLDGDKAKTSFLVKINLLTVLMLFLILTNYLWTFFGAWFVSNILLVSLMIHKSSWRQALKSGEIALSFLSIGFICLFLAIFTLNSQYDINFFSDLLATKLDQKLIIGFALLIPAMIQSAQIPFSKWFLSSLNSPTPVSAFMHAGLINGGGILLIKFFPLIKSCELLMNLIFVIGSITALLCSASMLVQTKIKNKLACSTAGQMGFMFMEIGAGLIHVAVLHLIMHGLYKSYLFLNSSSVVFEKVKDSLKNEVLRRNPPNKNFKDPLPEPRFSLGSGLKNRRSRIFQWILKVSKFNVNPIFDLLASSLVASIVTIIFSYLAGINNGFKSTETLMLAFTFVSVAQFIFSAIKTNPSISFRASVFTIAVFITLGFAFIIRTFHESISESWLSSSVEASLIHYFIILLVLFIWLAINVSAVFKLELENSLRKRLYMFLVNFAKPFDKTVTTQRKYYAY